MATISKLLTALNECTEWGQVFILDSLASYQPKDEREAQNICERVTPRLSHANAAVVLSAVKVWMKTDVCLSDVYICWHFTVHANGIFLPPPFFPVPSSPSSPPPSSSSSSTIIQVLMKFMEMMSPDTEYLQQLTKKLAPPLGNNIIIVGRFGKNYLYETYLCKVTKQAIIVNVK